ncbi:bifunctional glutamate N-acetyltransferase/amino-acid acetyltransferase ArgJ [Sinimarinibacterium sp. NLF-5-8]|uniref:bifunctional glutamate N-acetyltransferase/amino-acid acetyltransferase ArgJ n=1 Tax=Sinimarinibacterium sp. NLF-5-8 TaxID=2698684 RepID=UPI00137BA046|nr:bifunctional glutamate N-acetyltransferase/amino-acid acetyltransferase ArgJ [Sinimarinibacterium sp. NLF-5-8]QHS10252.1 bifunctional glutamate N-acetyltransferase/amino-acid acetyltransferase ArgJ [Sinimarinibacterium sp. NLF-5-8]
MAVNLTEPAALLPVAGVRLGVAQAAIKKPGRDDLLIIELVEGSRVAGVFTQNAFAAAPVQLCRQRLGQSQRLRALLINAGNANAATGRDGLDDARQTTAAVARALGCDADQVLPFSTGVIGQRLPVARMTEAIPRAVAALEADHWNTAARAIMTTDTVPKGVSARVMTAQGEVTITGIAKGVGMIEPHMATMLGFIATDARLTDRAVDQALRDAVNVSFNCVTVDSDTSTNDSCVLCATAQVGAQDVDVNDADYAPIAQAIRDVCTALAQSIVRDGEGATRFITLDISGARDGVEARQVGYAIANSPLVKTAMFAGDANWGRIVMAIGKAGVENLDPARVDVRLDDVQLLQGGEPHPDYVEERGAAVVAKPEFTIGVDLGRGSARARLWSCDFSYEYVKINAEYRT